MTDQPDPTQPQSAADPSLPVLRARLIQAELRAAAREAGMHDMDGLRLLDQSALMLNENMELPEAVALIARLKHDKPYLFTTRSSSTAASPPAAAAATARNAMNMTLEEWRAARAELLRRR